MVEKNSIYKIEILAGVTTFMAMAYILIVNPLILSMAGMPLGPLVIATAIVAGVSTLLTGIYAKKPFAMAPYMGENVLFTFTIVLGMGIAWQQALGAVFWGGLIFLIITLLGLRPMMAKAVPNFLSAGWSVGIGLFLMFVGFANAGISLPGVPGAPVHVGNLGATETLVALAGIAITLGFLLKNFKPGILIGIVITMILAWLAGIPVTSEAGIQGFPSLGEVAMKLDIMGAIMNPALIPIIILLFMVDLFDTMGTVLGLSHKAGFVDEKGNPKDVEKVFHVDAIASIIAPIFGVSTTGTYIESATGIEAGGRTGLTSIVTGILFLLAIPLAKYIGGMNGLFLQLASAPALVAVGILMMSMLGKIRFDDMVHVVPLAATLGFMLFTYNIALGIAASLVTYPLTALITGRKNEIHPISWMLFIIGLLLFILYPY